VSNDIKKGVLQYDCADQRWQIFSEDRDSTHELHCGDTFQVCVDGHWFDTRIEHNGKGYYLMTRGLQLCVGLEARTYR
jgi:hypothetical protein